MRRSVLAVPGYESKPVLLARPAREGPLEAARPRQGHRIVVRSVSSRASGVRAADRRFGLSGLMAAECVARGSGASCRTRDDARVVSRLDAARGARARWRTRPRATPTTSRRAPSTWLSRCWSIPIWINVESNCVVRSRPSTRVCWRDFWRSGRGPPRLCRYRGRKTGSIDLARGQQSVPIRRRSISSRPARRPTLELPPLLRSELPCLDANRVRFDYGPSRADCTRDRFGPVSTTPVPVPDGGRTRRRWRRVSPRSRLGEKLTYIANQ